MMQKALDLCLIQYAELEVSMAELKYSSHSSLVHYDVLHAACMYGVCNVLKCTQDKSENFSHQNVGEKLWKPLQFIYCSKL